MRGSVWCSLSVAAVLLAPALASAQYSPTPIAADPSPDAPGARGTGVHEHDGFYLRLTLGLGYTHMSASYRGDDMAFKGGATSIGLALGGAASPNLIVYGELWGTAIAKPTTQFNTREGELDGTVSAGGLGAGLAYYLESTNVYFSGTFLLESLSAEDNRTDEKFQSDSGVGGVLSVGKEWWTSDNWGVGLAAQFHAASIKERDLDYRWKVWSFAIACSATFN